MLPEDTAQQPVSDVTKEDQGYTTVSFKAKKGTPWSAATTRIRSFSIGLLESAYYRKKLRERVCAGKAPQVEVLLYHYAYGKPREVVEIQASDNLSGLLTLALGGAIIPGMLAQQQLLPEAPGAVVDVLAQAAPPTEPQIAKDKEVKWPDGWKRRGRGRPRKYPRPDDD